jgi:DNA-binding MarR family transcriptional regulator
VAALVDNPAVTPGHGISLITKVFATFAPTGNTEVPVPLPRHFKLDADGRARLGSQLIRLAHRYDRALAERLARFKLSPTHYEILKLLYAAPDYSLSHSQLADAMGVTLPSITLAVRKLGVMRLIGQQRAQDRRRRLVSLTVKGAEFLAPLYDTVEQFAADLFGAVPDKQAGQVGATIAALLARLSALEKGAVTSQTK